MSDLKERGTRVECRINRMSQIHKNILYEVYSLGAVRASQEMMKSGMRSTESLFVLLLFQNT